jgi:hypothetical protein
VGQWRADGTRNVERRISKDPDGFLDSVANECMFGDCSGGGAGETHRTQGTAGFGGGGGRWSAPAEEPNSDMMEELAQHQRKTGYYR